MKNLRVKKCSITKLNAIFLKNIYDFFNTQNKDKYKR